MMQISVPYSTPKVNVTRARSLARHIAEQNDGAAFDPQEEGLVWPRGRPERVPKRADEITSRVGLEWFLPVERWVGAPQVLVELLARRCPEALPTRYGEFEPPQHRFDPACPSDFVEFLLHREDDGFWFAKRPSFGGSWFAPPAEKWARPDEEHLRIAKLEVDFDGRVLEQDARWRDVVVDLFVTAAARLGAFFAAGQVEPGWTVTRTNRLYGTAETLGAGEHFLRGRLWQGLPPVPVWLSWFGRPYKNLVAGSLAPDAFDATPHSRSLRNRILRRSRTDDVTPTIVDADDGIFVRLGEQPRERDRLPAMPLPPELTYTHRPPTEDPSGAVTWNPAKPEVQADEIPSLSG
jgi:hypothetical protein